MKTVIRRAGERGHFDFGWLDTSHTFSFGEYYDPRHMGFRALRVLNEDRVAPGEGFPTHGHRDMEIVTWVLEGTIAHKDSMGTGSEVHPGEAQRMSAGTGVRHSEYNASKREPLHFIQIWIVPERTGMTPSYEQKRFSAEERTNQLRLIGAGDARDGALRIHQDVDLYAATLAPGARVTHAVRPDRHAWLQVTKGTLTLDGETLKAGDGMAVSGEGELLIASPEGGDLLLFDLS